MQIQNHLHAKIHHVDIRTQAHVVSEIPADVVRIVVDDDFIGAPEPTVAESDVGGRDGPVPAIEPEAIGTSAAKMPHMPGTEASGKVAVRPGVVDVIARIVGTGVMTNPGFALIDVRRVGVARLRVLVALRIGRLRRSMVGSGPALGRLRMVVPSMLREGRHREHEQSCECNVNGLHRFLLMT